MAEVQDITKPDDVLDDDEELEEEKETWSGRWSFILAAIGSAVGLGNVWRAPQLFYKWGGGAFFIPYVIALCVVGIPLLQLELAIGQVFRKAATQGFGMLSSENRFRGIGLGGAIISFGIVTYYAAILGWGLIYLFEAFKPEMPWSARDIEDENVTALDQSINYFVDLVKSTPIEDATGELSIPVFFATLAMWIIVFGILFKGTKFISKAVYVTVLLPVFMMFILVGVGASLPGSQEGIKNYIGVWDMSLLSEGEMWLDAFGQIFFSLSISTGVMTAYASMNPKNGDIVKDAIIIGVSNSLFSFLAGFAVFCVVGFFAEESGMTIEELEASGLLGGASLAFITYPAGLSMMDGYAANFMTILFFVTFFFLGVDSAFSLVESVAHNVAEVSTLSHKKLVIITCGLGACVSTIYTMDIGGDILDVVDAYVSTFGLTFIGFVEALAAGWVYNKGIAIDAVGQVPVLVFDFLVLGGFTLFTILSLTLPNTNPDLESSSIIGISIGVGIVPIILGLVIPPMMGASKAGGFKEALDALALSGPRSLQDRLNETITDGKPSNWKFSIAWSFNLKFIVTPMLLFLLGVRVESLAAGKGFNREKFEQLWLQMIGATLFMLILLVVLIGVVAPKVFENPKSRRAGRGVQFEA